MQTLYEWEFRDDEDLDEIMSRNIHEFEKDVDASYVEKVVKGTNESWEKINKIIEEAAPEWPLDQIAAVDKNTLRVAIFELLFDKDEEVPPKVCINEAVEIGKSFGGESSSKFINGVLGQVYRKNEKKLAPRDQR